MCLDMWIVLTCQAIALAHGIQGERQIVLKREKLGWRGDYYRLLSGRYLRQTSCLGESQPNIISPINDRFIAASEGEYCKERWVWI